MKLTKIFQHNIIQLVGVGSFLKSIKSDNPRGLINKSTISRGTKYHVLVCTDVISAINQVANLVHMTSVEFDFGDSDTSTSYIDSCNHLATFENVNKLQ